MAQLSIGEGESSPSYCDMVNQFITGTCEGEAVEELAARILVDLGEVVEDVEPTLLLKDGADILQAVVL